MQHLEDTSTPVAVTLAIIAYSLCSSTLLLLNKMSLEYLRSPSVVSLFQILFATVVVFILKIFNITKVDNLELEKIKAYIVYIIAFVLAIYCNMKALAASNVETVIVFRACTPLAVSIVEYSLMDRQFPELRSQLSLIGVAVFAILYCLTDSQFNLNGFSAYYWVLLYFLLITFEMTYGKSLTSNVKMDTVWGPVLYCNLLSIIPMFIVGSFSTDYDNIQTKLNEVPVVGAWLILFSCVVGTLIGYSGWLCRGMVSATTYTLVGVINKFLTILLNVFLWDKHASPFGLFCVCCCLLCGIFYQQAPKRTNDTVLPFNNMNISTTLSPRNNKNNSSPRKELELNKINDEIEPLNKK